MRHGKTKGLVLAVAVLAGTLGLVSPNAGAVDCGTTIKIGSALETEGETIEFPVTVSASTTCHTTGSVSYGTAPLIDEHAAVPGVDYDPAGGNLQWDKPLGAASRTVYAEVALLADDELELQGEVFQGRIFDSIGATIAGQWATGTIKDLAFKSHECVICPFGPCKVTVEQSAPTSHPITVSYATVDGSARAGADFAGVRDGRLTIPAGATQASITVDVFPNSPGEPAEAFYVVLTGVSAGAIDRGRTELHIPGS